MTTKTTLKSIVLTGILSISMINMIFVNEQPIYAASRTTSNQVVSFTKYNVKAKSTKVRATDSFKGKAIATLYKGAEVTVIGEKNNWSQVQYNGNKNRWIRSKDLEKAYVPQARKRVVSVDTTIKETASSKSSNLKRLKKGTVVYDLRVTKGIWTKIEDGHYEGWVLTKYLR